jgi:hypothetical protein
VRSSRNGARNRCRVWSVHRRGRRLAPLLSAQLRSYSLA